MSKNKGKSTSQRPDVSQDYIFQYGFDAHIANKKDMNEVMVEVRKLFTEKYNRVLVMRRADPNQVVVDYCPPALDYSAKYSFVGWENK